MQRQNELFDLALDELLDSDPYGCKPSAMRARYADFLQQRGEELLSQMVRLEGRLLELSKEDPLRPELERRREQVWAERQQQLAAVSGGSLSPEQFQWRWSLLEVAEVPVEDCPEAAELTLKTTPVEGLMLTLPQGQTTRSDELVRLLRCDSLHRLLYLEMPAISNHEGVAYTLASQPSLQQLRGLDCSGKVWWADAPRVLASSANFPNLRLLKLVEVCFTDEAASILAESEHFGHLRVLDLSWNAGYLTNRGIERFARSRALPRLRELFLLVSGDEGREEGNARHLQDLRGFAGLQLLSLACREVKDQGAAYLAESPHLKDLRELDLGYTGIQDAGAAALAASPYLRGLQRLWLEDNELSDESWAQLKESPLGHAVSRFGGADYRW